MRRARAAVWQLIIVHVAADRAFEFILPFGGLQGDFILSYG